MSLPKFKKFQDTWVNQKLFGNLKASQRHILKNSGHDQKDFQKTPYSSYLPLTSFLWADGPNFQQSSGLLLPIIFLPQLLFGRETVCPFIQCLVGVEIQLPSVVKGVPHGFSVFIHFLARDETWESSLKSDKTVLPSANSAPCQLKAHWSSSGIPFICWDSIKICVQSNAKR